MRSDSDGALTVTFMKGNEVIPNAPAAAGSYRVIVNTEATKNYLVGNKEFSFEIRKAPLTVKAKDQTAYVGDKIPALGEDSYTVSGLVGKDTLTGDVTLKYDPETPNMTKNADDHHAPLQWRRIFLRQQQPHREVRNHHQPRRLRH